MPCHCTTSAVHQPQTKAFYVIADRLAWLLALGVVIFFSLALIGQPFFETTRHNPPPTNVLLFTYGSAYSFFFLYLLQRKKYYLWGSALIFSTTYLADFLLNTPWGLSYLALINPLQPTLLPLMWGLTIFLLSCLFLTTFVRFRQQQYQKTQLFNELQQLQQITPFGRLVLDADGNIHQYNSLFKHWVTHYQLPTPIKHWSQYFNSLNWLRVVNNTQRQLATQTELTPLAQDIVEELGTTFCLFGFNEKAYRTVYLIPAPAYQALMMASNIHPSLTHTYSIKGLEGLFNQLQQELQRGDSPQSSYAAYVKIQHRNLMPNELQESDYPVSETIHHYLNQRYRTPYYVGKINQHEYLLIITQQNTQQAQHSLTGLSKHLQRSVLIQNRAKQKTQCHIGLVELTNSQPLAEVLSLAHSACEQAIHHDQTLTLYKKQSPEIKLHRSKLHFFKQLHKGKTKGLFLLMQPIINLKDPTQHYHVEVLLRYRNQQNKFLPTQHLICAAEQNGSITQIDKWVIQTALIWLSQHHQELNHIDCVNLNISGVSLNDPLFIKELFEILNRYPTVLSKVCIEITESIALADLSYTRELMENLQNLGVRIALDDFGAGYTSFSYLRELPANALKIDGSLIKDMLQTSGNTAIVRTIVELAQNLGMCSIAEWVEDTDTLLRLQQMGVDYVQGFAVSKAIEPTLVLQHKNILPLVQNPSTALLLRQSLNAY